ncbi:molybdopterin-guanine dinucleotide biosynthesis protein B [Helicobacter cholecystus]|uniref:Molybdopterin-guanine dinucleotide biosynthesis protein B n=1 Tax=Helicobacter cholecystus TaxID=45498 RepID=A0A3D8IYJ4_9HELI|nr:molybdopterin-guanine dinucleotide biosynthesis protein B [Helicobacter cholecystus]RDU69631.1 molybdopterin-guanine dinucleotide biosynthesis protein B [Helicobacter cholecystus]VEJ24191.1 molybdopterin-guanine dinucleotide biosynthesis protein MobB [Helicobacter cholecystus]
MARVVGFCGISNSGKTTLIEKLSLLLRQKEKKVFILKHDPKDKAKFDTEGKDSYRFFQSGADVAVYSPNKTIIMIQNSSPTLQQIITPFLKEWDYIFIEGLRDLKEFEKILVARERIEQGYEEGVKAFALKNIAKVGENVLDLDNISQILEWINLHIKDEK